jgi:hypothetical protein
MKKLSPSVPHIDEENPDNVADDQDQDSEPKPDKENTGNAIFFDEGDGYLVVKLFADGFGPAVWSATYRQAGSVLENVQRPGMAP